jgi:hypothetical protein
MSESAAEPGAETEAADPRQLALERLRWLLVGGGLVYVLGFAIVLISRPRTQIQYGDPVHVGSPVGVLFGYAIGSVGFLVLLVGLIGYGVKAGMEAVSR